jgi:hypothetical protein
VRIEPGLVNKGLIGVIEHAVDPLSHYYIVFLDAFGGETEPEADKDW